MALVFAIMHLYNFLKFCIVSVHSFFIFFFNLVLINYIEWLIIPACPSLMCSFNRGNTEQSKLENLCLIFVSSVLFYVCKVIGFVD